MCFLVCPLGSLEIGRKAWTMAFRWCHVMRSWKVRPNVFAPNDLVTCNCKRQICARAGTGCSDHSGHTWLFDAVVPLYHADRVVRHQEVEQGGTAPPSEGLRRCCHVLQRSRRHRVGRSSWQPSDFIHMILKTRQRRYGARLFQNVLEQIMIVE